MAAAAIPAAMGGIQAIGGLLKGQMTSDSLNMQANYQQQQALEAQQAGQANAEREQLISSQKIGTSIAAYGASGVDVNHSGSVLDVLGSSAANAELDRLNILHGADLKAINYQNQASLDRMGASSALSGSYFSALGSLAGGGLRALGNTTSGGGGSGEDPELDASDMYAGGQ